MWNRLTRTIYSKCEITVENNTEFFIISDLKLIKQRHSRTNLINIHRIGGIGDTS